MRKTFVAACAVSAAASAGVATSAWAAEDKTLLEPLEPFASTQVQSLDAVTGGDIAEIDVEAVGTAVQYIGVVLNGDGANANAAHVFVKVQNNGSLNSQFDSAACYIGNNGLRGDFGPAFFFLEEAFTTAHMKVERVSNTVTIAFTEIDGDPKKEQMYVCENAPTRVGDFIGIAGFAGIAEADNFADGEAVLDTFSFSGPLASSGAWTDAAPGMEADGAVAFGGPYALSFYTVPTLFCDGGFLPPFDKTIVLKKNSNRAIPVRAVIVNEFGTPMTDADIVASPVITVSFGPTVYGDVPPNDDDLAPLGAANDDNIVRFDPETETWIYNLGTKQFGAPGNYTVKMVSGNPKEYVLDGCSQSFERP